MKRILARATVIIASCLLLTVPGCGNERIAAPSAPTTATQVSPGTLQVGVKDGLPAIVVPGRTVALTAVLVRPDGSTRDVTKDALWQSSNPVAATVAGGIVSAAAEAVVDIKATQEGVSGLAKIEIRRTCEAATSTLEPAHSLVSQFEGSFRVMVRVASSDCRWTTAADGDFPFRESRPDVSGDGALVYSLEANNSPVQRSGRIRVVFPDASALEHTFTQDKPSCSYVTVPAIITLKASGGSGSFRLITTPESCPWALTKQEGRARDEISILSDRRGTGSTTVSYRITPPDAKLSRTYAIFVVGDESTSPPGLHQANVIVPD